MQVLKMEESKLQKCPRGYFVGLTTMDYVFYVNSHPQKNSKVKTNHFSECGDHLLTAGRKRYVGHLSW